MTDSVSLLSTLLNSLLDAAASLVNLVAVRTALTPADAEHRFGHGKAEPLAALGQSAFIAGSALFLLVEVRQPRGQSFADPEQRDRPRGHGLLDRGHLPAGSLSAPCDPIDQFRRHPADSLHYVSDLLVNGGVIAALLLCASSAGRLPIRCLAPASASISSIRPGGSPEAPWTC